jgi:NADH-ubiquinone oxidoreductase chain 3
VLCHANAQMYWTMNMFLALLVVGFVYEWGVGALEWRQ